MRGAGTEYGAQVYQNYQNGVRGGAMFTQNLNWRRIGMSAVGGAVGGLTGFGVGSALGGVGGGMAGRVAAGFVEGGLSDVASRMAMNAVMGCAWNEGLWSAFIGGGLGGSVGAMVGWGARVLRDSGIRSSDRLIPMRHIIFEMLKANFISSETKWISEDMIYDFLESPAWRSMWEKYKLPGYIASLARTVLSGHGAYERGMRWITVPEGT